MDELLLKLYEKHPFIQDNGARSLVTDKLVAKEFYKIGYNAAIEDFAEKILSTYGSYDSMDILEIEKQMKKDE